MVSGEVMAGDWMCGDCDINNFASRTHCFDCKKPRGDVCDAKEDEVGVKEPMNNSFNNNFSEVRDGDWECPSCGVNNFARRFSCFKCKTTKEGADRGSAPPPAALSDREFRSGDWSCSSCGTHNFARRNACFQCRKQRPDGPGAERDSNRYSSPYGGGGTGGGYGGPRGGGGGGRRVRNGDWMCGTCNYHNFARRDTCNECNGSRDDGNPVSEDQRGPRQQPGDWLCGSCNENNFARRTRCYRCDVAKPEGGDDAE